MEIREVVEADRIGYIADLAIATLLVEQKPARQ